MNSYDIYEEQHCETILFRAIARDEQHVRELAKEAGIDLTGITIKLDKKNVRDQLGRPYDPSIWEALVY